MGWIRDLSWSKKGPLSVLLLAGLTVGGLVVSNGSPDGGKKVDVLGVQLKNPPAIPTITSGPSGPTNSALATFEFRSNPAPGGYLCKLDGGSFSTCVSPKSYPGLSEGSHTFSVEGQDGTVTSAPATRTWSVDTIPPLVAPTITEKPDDPSFDTKPRFAYTASDAGVTFACQLDGAASQPCGSSVDYKKVAFGDHIFAVRAVDAAGNRSPAATYGWTVVENKAFAITGNAVGPVFPGVTQGLALKLSNPYNFSIRVEGVHATATKATPPCTIALGSLELVDLTAPIDIPPNSSVTLGSSLPPGAPWPAGWPTIKMGDSASNQDDCKNATFTLSYTGTATKS
jgi:hypothetical protein